MPIEPDELEPQDDFVPPAEPPASVSPLTSWSDTTIYVITFFRYFSLKNLRIDLPFKNMLAKAVKI